ncbi:protein of unknown function [Streptomyces murinus]
MPTPAAYSGATENCTQERRSPQTRRPPLSWPTYMHGGHPRRRGDHGGGKGVKTAVKGPPPHAGTTGGVGRRVRRRRDHPRTRGDHDADGVLEDPVAGPPPHARGPQVRVGLLHVRDGTTPARAGTTEGLCRQRRPRWDHPRTRGDH